MGGSKFLREEYYWPKIDDVKRVNKGKEDHELRTIGKKQPNQTEQKWQANNHANVLLAINLLVVVRWWNFERH